MTEEARELKHDTDAVATREQRKAADLEAADATRAAFANAAERTRLRYGIAQLIITTVGALVLAWIAYQQAALTITTERIEKNTNHLVSVLVEKTEKSSHAAGVADEKARQQGGKQVPNSRVGPTPMGGAEEK